MNYIISLIGLSPIPNYVGILNNIDKEKKNIVFLFYTNNSTTSSFELAKTIKKVLLAKIEHLDIRLIATDKSNFMKIKNGIKKLIDQIEYLNLEVRDKSSIILDITGSTKANSAIFYSEIKNHFLNEKIFILSLSYLDNFKRDIEVYDVNKKEDTRIYKIDEIIKRTGLSTKDILALYKKDDTHENITGDLDIYLDGFNLLFHKKTKELKIKDKKEEVFELFDKIEKLGGRFTRLVYEADDFFDSSTKSNDMMEHFLQKFTNEANNKYGHRLILKSKSENRYLKFEKGIYTNECKSVAKILGE